jgi:hypothetical protein
MTANVRREFVMFLLFFLLGCAAITCAQQPEEQSRKSLNYGFVSPNRRDDLKLEEAIGGMKSPEESNLMKRARDLGCVVRSRIRAFPSLGSWSDGAEYSVLIRVRTDEPTVRYLMSRMGRDATQKSVLYFHPQPTGGARIYTLRPRKRVRVVAIVRILDRSGIAFRTLVPLRRKTIVYVVDLKRELDEKVITASRMLLARVSSQSGNAEFVGDEELPQAKIAFEKEINGYEKTHPNLPPLCQ